MVIRTWLVIALMVVLWVAGLLIFPYGIILWLAAFWIKEWWTRKLKGYAEAKADAPGIQALANKANFVGLRKNALWN